MSEIYLYISYLLVSMKTFDDPNYVKFDSAMFTFQFNEPTIPQLCTFPWNIWGSPKLELRFQVQLLDFLDSCLTH